jgi:hypothetical protein
MLLVIGIGACRFTAEPNRLVFPERWLDLEFKRQLRVVFRKAESPFVW